MTWQRRPGEVPAAKERSAPRYRCFGVLVVVIVIWWLALSRQSVLQPSGTTPELHLEPHRGKPPLSRWGRRLKRNSIM